MFRQLAPVSTSKLRPRHTGLSILVSQLEPTSTQTRNFRQRGLYEDTRGTSKRQSDRKQPNGDFLSISELKRSDALDGSESDSIAMPHQPKTPTEHKSRPSAHQGKSGGLLSHLDPYWDRLNNNCIKASESDSISMPPQPRTLTEHKFRPPWETHGLLPDSKGDAFLTATKPISMSSMSPELRKSCGLPPVTRNTGIVSGCQTDGMKFRHHPQEYHSSHSQKGSNPYHRPGSGRISSRTTSASCKSHMATNGEKP